MALASSATNPSNGPTKIGGYAIDSEVLSGIRQASKKTGVDFGYLMAQAAQESSFQPAVKAATSSATGLYQFLDSTWLGMVRDAGPKHGLGDLAAKIGADGSVRDPEAKRQILELRKDPKVSAVIGAEFALSNKDQLESALGRKVGAGELYLAHFLGAGGATRFLKAVEKNANASAAEMMPQAAAANRWVFYDRETGAPRSVGDIYRMFSRSIESKSNQFAALSEGSPSGFANAAGPRFGSGESAKLGAYRNVASVGLANSPMGTVDLNGPTPSLFAILSMMALDLPGTGLGGSQDSGEKDAGGQAYRRTNHLI
jgi:hypothetical protein